MDYNDLTTMYADGNTFDNQQQQQLLLQEQEQGQPSEGTWNTTAGPREEEGWMLEDMWTSMSWQPLENTMKPAEGLGGKSEKRKRDHDQSDDLYFRSSVDYQAAANTRWLEAQADDLFPPLPHRNSRPIALHLINPFLSDSRERFTSLAPRRSLEAPEGGTVDGYIKFRWERRDSSEQQSDPVAQKHKQYNMGIHHRNRLLPFAANGEYIQRLPPNFASQLKLDATDARTMRFYTLAYCKGRTLLDKTNHWYTEIVPMASGNECVKHAILAFAYSYVLDYKPEEKLRQKANFHYKCAVDQFSKALSDPECVEVGKDDALVAAATLLFSHDIVNWEIRRTKEFEPLWRQGALAARQILDHTDPGYRYWLADNVQSTSARIGNANWVAYVDICAQPVTPISEDISAKSYSWLLEGQRKDAYKIHGSTGLCPKLLHIFSQITYLAGRLIEFPKSPVFRAGVEMIERKLEAFKQWSELSPGYESAKELFDACVCDDTGKVQTREEVTNLTAFCWVAAAQIYLQCRCYGKRTTHPLVQEKVAHLRHAVELMPCSGPLFTSQSPFFPVFLMGLVSNKQDDRRGASDWFEQVLSAASCRSSVEPVWLALQDTWRWFDTELANDPVYTANQHNGEIIFWWEMMVENLVATRGVLSLV